MGYLPRTLDEESREILNIIFKNEMIECCALLIGVKITGNLFQGHMMSLLVLLQMKVLKPSIDYIKHTKGKTLQEHLELVDRSCALMK